MNRLTRGGTAESVSRDQILMHERGQGSFHFSCSADHLQDWQPYPVDPYSCYRCDHTYIHAWSYPVYIVYMAVSGNTRVSPLLVFVALTSPSMK